MHRGASNEGLAFTFIWTLSPVELIPGFSNEVTKKRKLFPGLLMMYLSLFVLPHLLTIFQINILRHLVQEY
jgi:hypothetical protein